MAAVVGLPRLPGEFTVEELYEKAVAKNPSVTKESVRFKLTRMVEKKLYSRRKILINSRATNLYLIAPIQPRRVAK